MSKKLSRSDALEDISTWSTDDVLCLLRKNGLEDCCKAISKRQIDGDELLHLTEGKLALWKSDLTRPLIWSLWNFVEEIRKSPEKYVEDKILEARQDEGQISDTSPWDTDFEDEDIDGENADVSKLTNTLCTDRQIISNNRNNQRIFQENAIRQESETTYANCDSVEDAENTYANFQDTKNVPIKNTSRLHDAQFEKTLAEQLRQQLELRKKPAIGPKPTALLNRRTETSGLQRKQPQKSFLHDTSKIKQRHESQKKMAVPPPPEPKKNSDHSSNNDRFDKSSSKPPSTIRTLDLVANLPTRTEESEDEYESFDEQIIEQNQKKGIISRVDSRQSLTSAHQSSAESVYQPPSVTSYEEEEEQYEIYESITEAPEDNYLSPIQKTAPSEAPPPLPAKPHSSTPSPTPSYASDKSTKERSPEKKSATLPYSGSSASFLTERATRPLPPPPDRYSYTDKPWFHNVTREQATALISQPPYGSPHDGYFLLRPSTTNLNNPLALVLWFKDKVYNVPVRKRPDTRYALGSAKANEQTFSSVEEIVTFHTRNELVLHSNGVQTGSTKLTDTPAKSL